MLMGLSIKAHLLVHEFKTSIVGTLAIISTNAVMESF